MENEENENGKSLVIQGQRGSEVLYLDGPPSVWGSWRPTPVALRWDLEDEESAVLYLEQVRRQLPALMGNNVVNVRLVVWPLDPARVPSPPPEAVSPASAASALSPSPHSAATNGPRTEGEESPTSHPEPPAARETGEAGEAGEGGDLPRREKPVTVPSREGLPAGNRQLTANLFQKDAPPAFTSRSWGTSDFPAMSKSQGKKR